MNTSITHLLQTKFPTNDYSTFGKGGWLFWNKVYFSYSENKWETIELNIFQRIFRKLFNYCVETRLSYVLQKMAIDSESIALPQELRKKMNEIWDRTYPAKLCPLPKLTLLKTQTPPKLQIDQQKPISPSLSPANSEILFEDCSDLSEIFNISANPNAIKELENYFTRLNRDDKAQITKKLFDNYCRFLKWVKDFTQNISKEVDPEKRKTLQIEKSKIIDNIYNKNFNLISQIVQSNSSLFNELLCSIFVTQPKEELCLFIRSGGMQINIDHFISKKGFLGKWNACKNYPELEKHLQSIANDNSTNEWFYSVQCQDANSFGEHQAQVVIFRENNQYIALIIDSLGFNSPLGNLYSIIPVIHRNLSGIEMYSSVYVRQADLFNCSFFALKDLKKCRQAKQSIVDFFKKQSRAAIEFKNHYPYKDQDRSIPTSLQKLILDYPESVQHLHLTEDLPIELMDSVQSLSKLDLYP